MLETISGVSPPVIAVGHAYDAEAIVPMPALRAQSCPVYAVGPNGMVLPEGLQYDGMHTLAGNVKAVIFSMLGLGPEPESAVAQYDIAKNKRRGNEWVACKSTSFFRLIV